jgi:hypothetical protein
MRFALASALVFLTIGAAAAQDSDRYALEKSAQGYVRLDKKTGEMSICQETGGQLVCKLAADDRTAFEDEVDRLRTELDDVEKRVSALESGSGKSTLPTEEEFDQTMSYVQRFFRSFLDMVKEFDRDLRGNEEPGSPTPQKT